MTTVHDTSKIGQDGQVIHPVVSNEAEDGSGSWHLVIVDSSGRLKTVGVANPLFSTATGTAAIAKTVAPAAIFRLLRVELHLDSAPASNAENFTITLDAGDGAAYDVQLFKQDLYTTAVQDLVVEFGKGYEFEADDEIDIAWTNTPTETYGLRVVYELL